jgi:hypothetical protein
VPVHVDVGDEMEEVCGMPSVALPSAVQSG